MFLVFPLLRGFTRGLGIHRLLVLLAVACLPEARGQTETWSLRDGLTDGRSFENPVVDPHGEAVWYLLRTTTSEGAVEARNWVRDGKYVSLRDSGVGLFDAPVNGWAFRAAPPLAPLVGTVTADYDVGLTFEPGAVLVAPGPDHAVVIGWRSPVAGLLDIEGEFEHAQNCCGVNSRVAWYVERGPAPDSRDGFAGTSLASGASEFGSPSQLGRFKIEDQPVQPGDYVYFIVDAVADGTNTPHHGDATRLDVTLTVRDTTWPPTPTFEQDIRPILERACFDCHGDDTQEGRLNLTTVSEMLRGGENGPAIVRGDPHGSLLLDLIARGEMPPVDERQLSNEETSLLRRWIEGDTPTEELIVALPPHAQVTEDDRAFWAFVPPAMTTPPPVRHENRVRTPIDRFLLAALEQQGLEYSPDADRHVLIRRAYLDLLGIPPDPTAVRAFLDDPRPDAYERMIDDLLDSPHYGERWGRHWLDAAGYVDGKLDNDLGSIYPNAGIWRYRDYVIQALNDNKPFNQFLIEQLAGDELVDWREAETFDERTVSLLVATGFLRNVDDHTDFPQYGIEKRYEVVNETLDMVSTSLLGLTMECCRCHDHKYDPLPQRDYYRLMACFEPAYNPHDWRPPKDRYLADVSPRERIKIDQRNSQIDGQVAELSQAETEIRERVRRRVAEQRRAALPDDERVQFEQAMTQPPVSDADIDAALTDEEKAALGRHAARRETLLAEKQSYGVIQALWDVGPPPESHVHRRGNVSAHGVLVLPGFPEILQPPGSLTANMPEDARGATSGRRLALARWITGPTHPLTARVFVNRVWHHHFGRGIVETLGNFGRSGSPPSHPELLDWLAVDFVNHGWDIKRLHRRIMLSTAYRQSSRVSASDDALARSLDPDNRLLWRMNLRRLEAEIVRDSVLAVSGSLDRTAGGPPVEITNPSDGLSRPKLEPTATSQYRRSVYLFARRVYPLKFLEIFDAPIMPVNCTQRTNSATVLQSLALLNSEFLFEQSERMASEVIRGGGPGTRDRVERAFQMAFARPPSELEMAKSLAFLDAQERERLSTGTPTEDAKEIALADFCHMLLSSNEFLYVE